MTETTPASTSTRPRGAGKPPAGAAALLLASAALPATAAAADSGADAAILFFRQSEEEQLRQRLIDGGLDPARVDRAVKAGRAKELARRHGIPAKVRAGID